MTKKEKAELKKELEKVIERSTDWTYDKPEEDEYEYINSYIAAENVLSYLISNKLLCKTKTNDKKKEN